MTSKPSRPPSWWWCPDTTPSQRKRCMRESPTIIPTSALDSAMRKSLARRRTAASGSITAGSMTPCGGRPAFTRTKILCETQSERVKLHHNASGSTAVKTQRPITRDDKHVVLKFRPRTSSHPPGRQDEPGGQANIRQAAHDLSRYDRPREEPDDFRHRMLANIAAFAFTVALTAIGIWLGMSIA